MLRNIWYYVKDFFERCAYFYKNDKKYRKICLEALWILIIFNIICVFIYLFFDVNIFLFQLLMSLFIFLLRILESCEIIPSAYIKPNIGELPNKIWKYPVIVQYDAPKWLNPSEVWLLYNLKSLSTNLDSLIYKRENEGLVKIELRKDWYLNLYRNKDIHEKAPYYEKQYRKMVFWQNRREKAVWSMKSSWTSWYYAVDWWNPDLELLHYCVKKWRLCEKYNYLFLFALFAAVVIPLVLWNISWIFSIISFVLSIMYILYCVSKYWWTYVYLTIKRTDKWDELYAHIIWYKYWLEKCEEEQVKKILKDDSWFKSRTFPYVVALRLNWKFLDKDFNK